MGWQEAWRAALYGPDGFYREGQGPVGHFTTATHGPLGPVLAGAVLQLAADEGCSQIVDIGCGRGELLTSLRQQDPAIGLTGVDVVDRPKDLADDIRWMRSPGGTALPDELDRLEGALVFAHEWLDVVPCAIAAAAETGELHHVLVHPETGAEEQGLPVTGPEREWADRHWPVESAGDRVEIGLARDVAWAGLLDRLRSGIAVAVDYGHRGGERPSQGTLTAYRQGSLVAPVPDGSCDLTAHVAMDTLDHDELLDQRTALRGLGVRTAKPPRHLATSDPRAYLHSLSQASAAGALTARGGFGDFWWALKRVG